MPRVLVAVCALLVASFAAFAQQGTVFKDASAEATFRRARVAVGRGEGVDNLKALVLKGSSRVAFGSGDLVPASVVIKILLPDHYLRVDTAGGSRLVTGFAGKNLLTAIEQEGQRSVPPAEMHDSLRKVEEARLARLLLATTAYVSPYYFITFRSIGAVQALAGPEFGGTVTTRSDYADNILEGAGRDGFFVRLFIRPNGYPVKMEYRTTKDHLNVIALDDRRESGGFLFPFRITTMDGKRTLDDLVLDEVAVNPLLTAADFRQ